MSLWASVRGIRRGDLDWQDDAACRHVDGDVFFPGHGTDGAPAAADVEAAKRVCADCPVRLECLAYAIRAGEPHGIWGGHTTGERKRIARECADLGEQVA